MASKRYTEQQVVDAILTSRSWRQVLDSIGLCEAGGNYNTVQGIADRNNVTTSHLKGKAWAKGTVALNARPLEDYLQVGVRVKSNVLKGRLIKAGLLEDKCIECEMGNEWQGKPIVLELDHINGNKLDNRLENLRVLCPNCHSQTPTFRGRLR